MREKMKKWLILLGAASAGAAVAAVIVLTASSPSSSSRSSSASSSSSSRSVPCALTHAAGADGTNSCWATHTGVQNGTGFTVAQILAGQSTLKHVVGDQTITTPGTVISNEWISGCVGIQANNVTITNTLVYSNGDNCRGGINNSGGSQPSALNNGQNNPATGTVLQDVTVDGNNATGDQYGVSLEDGAQCIRCNSFGFAKNFFADGSAGATTVFTDSYSHDFSLNSQCAHEDGWWLPSSTYVTIEHSYAIDSGIVGCVDGVIATSDVYGPPGHLTFDHTYMEGNGGQDWHGACGATYFVMTNDAFSSHDTGYGPWQSTDTGNTWSGNYVAESPSSVFPPGGPQNCSSKR